MTSESSCPHASKPSADGRLTLPQPARALLWAVQQEYEDDDDDRVRLARGVINGLLLSIGGWTLLIGLPWYVARAIGISWRGVAIAGGLAFVIYALAWLADGLPVWGELDGDLWHGYPDRLRR